MIKIYCHKDTGVLTVSIGGARIASITAKHNTTLEREVVFHDGAAVVTLDVAAAGVFVAKTKPTSGGPTGVLRVWDVEWVPTGLQGGGYVFSVPLWGANLEAVTAEEDGRKLLSAAVHFTEPDRSQESQTFDLIVEPPVFLDDETPDDPEDPYPLPSSILTKAGNLAGLADKAAARANLDIVAGALVNKVSTPASSATAGQPGDFAATADYLYLYTGNGTTHTWLRIAGANDF